MNAKSYFRLNTMTMAALLVAAAGLSIVLATASTSTTIDLSNVVNMDIEAKKVVKFFVCVVKRVLDIPSTMVVPAWPPSSYSDMLNWLLMVTVVNCIMVLVLFSFQKKMAPFRTQNVPVTPNAHWLVGHAFSFWDYKKSLTTKYKELFGKAVVNDMGLGSIFLGYSPFLVVTRCEDVQNVLRTSSTTAVNRQIRRHYAKRAGDDQALAHLAQGKVWKVKRQFVHKIFTRNLPNCTEGMIKVARDLASSVLTMIRSSASPSSSSFKQLANNDDTQRSCLVDVERITTLAMFDNFGIMAFGHDFGVCKTMKEHKVALAIAHQFDDFEGRVKDVLNPFSQFYFIPTSRNLARQKTDDTIQDFYRSKIEERLDGKSTGNETDVLSYLQNEIKKNDDVDDKKGEGDGIKKKVNGGDKKKVEGGESAMTIQSAVQLLQTLFNGATTTSAGTLMFALYAASEHPRVEQRILEEVHRVIGPRRITNEEDEEPVQKIDIGELEYCRAVILETVRLYPSIPANTRVLEHDTELGGETFKPGTKVMLPVFAVQRDERHFPEPLEFYPERWVEPKKDGAPGEWVRRDLKNKSSSSSLTTKYTSNNLVDGVFVPPANLEAFVAFSSGGRNCVGQKLAIHQTTIGLAYLVRDIQMKVPDDYVLDLYYEGLTMRPRYGMPMECTERKVTASASAEESPLVQIKK